MPTNPLLNALERIKPHQHLCASYEGEEDRLAVAVPYLRIGLERGERCLYIGHDGSEEIVRKALQAAGTDVEREVETGALVLISKDEAYMKQGRFDPDRMLDFWSDAAAAATAAGFKALRGVGQTDWMRRGSPGLERWVEYESRLTQILARCNCLALCQYHRSLTPPALLLGVMRTHPTVIYAGTACPNHFYIPPEDFLNGRSAEREVERLLESVLARERVNAAMRRQEAAMLRSEAYLAEAQRISQTGSWAWNAASGELFWSQEHFRIFGLEGQAQPTGEQAVAMIDPEDRPGAVASWERATGERQPFEHEFRIVRPDGSRRHVQSVGRPVFDGSGALKEYIGTLLDVTERREAERKVRQSSENLELILASITDNFFAFSKDWRHTYLNRHAAEQMRTLGMDPAELIGKVLWEVFPHVPNEQAMRRVMTERVPVTDELYYPPLGQWVENHMYPGYDGGIVVFQRYITDRKRAEEALHNAREELAHVNRALTVAELIASIAHELNQPLAAVVANANACERWLLGPHPEMDEAMASLSRITRDANRASSVISRIRMLLQNKPPAREDVRMDEVVREVLTLVLGEARTKAITLSSAIAEELPVIVGDRVRLQQVVLNLAVNAIEAMSGVAGPRRLDLSVARAASDGVAVSVRDTGSGLEPRHAARVFDAFFTTKPQGMGMGLAISRSIVEAHHGKLWAAPNDGPGATFHFTLPGDQKP